MTLAYPTPNAHTVRPEHSKRRSPIAAAVVRRAGIVAVVLGSILTLVNQFDALFGEVSVQILPLLLVYLTPFVVVTISQVLGIRRALYDARRGRAHDFSQDTFTRTAVSHGIPLRSLLVGMLVGSINASIVITIAVLEGASVNSLPVALLAQAYSLPVLFGLLSQAIAYRRATQSFRLPKVAHWTGTARSTIHV